MIIGWASIPGWFLSPDEGKRGRRLASRRRVPMAFDYGARAASNRVSRFVWNLIPLRRVVKSRYIARQKANGRTSHPLDASRPTRRRRFSYAIAINRTYVTFSTFQLYWIGRGYGAIDNVCHARCDYRGGFFEMSYVMCEVLAFCFDKNFRVMFLLCISRKI